MVTRGEWALEVSTSLKAPSTPGAGECSSSTERASPKRLTVGVDFPYIAHRIPYNPMGIFHNVHICVYLYIYIYIYTYTVHFAQHECPGTVSHPMANWWHISCVICRPFCHQGLTSAVEMRSSRISQRKRHTTRGRLAVVKRCAPDSKQKMKLRNSSIIWSLCSKKSTKHLPVSWGESRQLA